MIGSNDDSSKIPLPTGLWVLNNALAGPTVYLPGPHYDDDGQTQLKKKPATFLGSHLSLFFPPLWFVSRQESLSPLLLSITSSLGAHWQQQPRNSKLSRFRSQRFHCERGLTEAEIAFAVAPRLDLVDTGPSTGGQDQPRPLLLASSSSSSSS